MRSHSWLNSAKSIIDSYDGSMPLAAWMKFFFRENKRIGSKDRKEISHICYCFYRLGFSFKTLPLEDKMLKGLFLCSTVPNKVLEELKPEWNGKTGISLEEKSRFINEEEELQKVFPFTDALSSEIERFELNRSFFIQPDVFLRVRTGMHGIVREKLSAAAIHFKEIDTDCIAVPASIKVHELLQIDKDAVVQDFNSQQTIHPLLQVFQPDQKFDVWDCCAASGGKSILLHDRFPKAAMLSSDIRPAIIYNLQKRFERAGIKGVQTMVLNAATSLPKRKFDLVICDAPCSGSGTWSRTPEQIRFYTPEKIERYAALQKSILNNTSQAIRPGGYLLYITCSVFQKENEEVVNSIDGNILRLETLVYLKGYDKKADTLFVALFSRL